MKCKKGCFRCCEFIRIELTSGWDKEYLKTRGLTQLDGYFPILEIPHLCPQLKNDRCKLGNKRPKICRKFQCEEMQ